MPVLILGDGMTYLTKTHISPVISSSVFNHTLSVFLAHTPQSHTISQQLVGCSTDLNTKELSDLTKPTSESSQKQ